MNASIGGTADPPDPADLARIQELTAVLEGQPHSAVTAAARELLQWIFVLHGQGLARLIELIGGSADGAALLDRAVHDEEVRALLLLHGLHPQELDTRVAAAVAALRPSLAVYGIRIEGYIRNGGVLAVTLHCTPASGVTPPPAEALRREIETAVYGLAPDLETVTVEGLPVPAAYVPLTQLARAAKAASGRA
jgi:hypothetical protein